MIRFTALLFVSFPLFCNASIPVEGFFDAKKVARRLFLKIKRRILMS
ncbi:hypothetical protein Loa_02789 [Legionella oakridgensis ATCC 33761 = DSM 21215]|uniref:Uncharacterized protein n=1 Tax=Legionella oakridgensis ATCC 33761 = DSM 21215 TaxID=1268635 RepID=W0BIT5_9GAMM|nr:hypothetical protein [Legionella oakridgensis]AHE68319.1 hypothetical protein Loa_02789 [Legionella oakridgensis ATCC 33761 = DSM 21215]